MHVEERGIPSSLGVQQHCVLVHGGPEVHPAVAPATYHLHLLLHCCADDRDAEGSIAIGKLRGEDYNFEFHGKVKDGKMHFRLHMTQVGTGAAAVVGQAAGQASPMTSSLRSEQQCKQQPAAVM